MRGPLFLTFIALAAAQRFWFEGREHRHAHRGMVRMAWTGYLMAGCHLLTYAGTALEMFLHQREILLQPVVSMIGLIMFLLGFLLRRWAISTLGSYWSLQIEIRRNQPLVRTGPYRFVRHPNYAALFLEVLGLPLVGNAYWTLLFVVLGYCPLILVRAVYEERVLIETFPQTYRQYQQECGAFFPRIWRRSTVSDLTTQHQ